MAAKSLKEQLAETIATLTQIQECHRFAISENDRLFRELQMVKEKNEDATEARILDAVAKVPAVTSDYLNSQFLDLNNRLLTRIDRLEERLSSSDTMHNNLTAEWLGKIQAHVTRRRWWQFWRWTFHLEHP